MQQLSRRRLIDDSAEGWPMGVIEGLRLTIRKMWAATSGSEVNVVQMNEICIAKSISTASTQAYHYNTASTTYTTNHVYDTTGPELPNKAVNNVFSGDKMCIHLYSRSITNLTTINNNLAADPSVITWTFPRDSNFVGSVYDCLYFITGGDSAQYGSRTPRSFMFELLSDGVWYKVADFDSDANAVPSDLRASNMGVILVENGAQVSGQYYTEDVLTPPEPTTGTFQLQLMNGEMPGDAWPSYTFTIGETWEDIYHTYTGDFDYNYDSEYDDSVMEYVGSELTHGQIFGSSSTASGNYCSNDDLVIDGKVYYIDDGEEPGPEPEPEGSGEEPVEGGGESA